MKILLTAAAAALAMCAMSASTAYAQDNNNCPVTTTTSTGPNGETITRREACGAVEITTSGGRPNASSSTSRTSSTSSSTSNATTSGDSRTRTNTETRTTTTSTPGRTETSTSSRTSSSTVTRPSAPAAPPVRAGGENWSIEVGGSGNVHDNDFDDFDVMTPPRDFARIVLFDRADFRGRSIGITQDTPNLARRSFQGRASAARVQAGVWELCTEPNYGGACVTTDASLDLSSTELNDSVASVRRVRR